MALEAFQTSDHGNRLDIEVRPLLFPSLDNPIDMILEMRELNMLSERLLASINLTLHIQSAPGQGTLVSAWIPASDIIRTKTGTLSR
jgi:hypothetical protein